MLASVAQAGQAPREATRARRLVGPAIMVACGVASVLYGHGVAAKVTAGALVAGAEGCLLLTRRFPVQRPGLLAAGACIAATPCRQASWRVPARSTLSLGRRRPLVWMPDSGVTGMDSTTITPKGYTRAHEDQARTFVSAGSCV